MSSEMDELEAMVMAEMRATFSSTVMDHGMNPRNMGRIDDANGFASIKGPCGDTMQIWIKVEDNIIVDAGFLTDGCGTSAASGSMATVLAKGHSVEDIRTISQKDVLEALDGLPEDSEHCALLAANTMKAAIEDHLSKTR